MFYFNLIIVSRLSSSDATKDTVEEAKAKPKSVLDKLFRKTKAAPPIYWLPLSDKEVSSTHTHNTHACTTHL